MNYAIAKVKDKFGFNVLVELEPEQLEIIKSVIEEKDVFGLLPTGFGKLMTYIFVPLVLVMDAKYCYFYFFKNRKKL